MVVDNVSLDVASGEVVGLLGPNGAGKTTCFYMIAGLIPTEGGSISINGNDISNLPMHARAHGWDFVIWHRSLGVPQAERGDNILAMLEARAELPAMNRSLSAIACCWISD